MNPKIKKLLYAVGTLLLLILAVKFHLFEKMNTLQRLLTLTAGVAIGMVCFAPQGKNGQTNPITFGAINLGLYGILAILATFVAHYMILNGHKSAHHDKIFYLLLFSFLAMGIFLLVPTKIGPEEKKDEKKEGEDGKDDKKSALHVAIISLLGQPIHGLVVSQGWTFLIKGIMSLSLIKSDWDVLTLKIEMISADNAPFTCEVSFRYRIKDFYVAIFENGIADVMKGLEDTVEACLTAFARSLEAEILTKLGHDEKVTFIRNFLQPDLEAAAIRYGVEVEVVAKGKVVLRMDDFVCTDDEFKSALMLDAITKRSMQAVNTRTDEFEKLFRRFFALYNTYMTPGDAAEAARNDAKVQIGAAEERVFKGLGGGALVETGDGTATSNGNKGGGKKNNRNKKK
jgi:hypothetical protein